MLKRILKILGIVIGVILLLAVALVVFLSVTEFKPADRGLADRINGASHDNEAGQRLTIYAWNIGYGGLGEESDFFMDGGKMVDPPDQETVEKNLEGIEQFVQNNPADVWLLQEIDVNSARTGGVDEFDLLFSGNFTNGVFAYNYKCPFVPIPVPPIGRVESGIATLSDLYISDDAERISLPCPFAWPIRAAQIKRCLLITRTPVEGTDRELVLVNLHLEAYDDGEGKIAQTKLLMEVLQQEYARGNYVIAGGDFNQTFPGSLDHFPIRNSEKWTPGVLEQSILPEGWQFAADVEGATCRLLDQPFCADSQLYVIDGFILSPNVRLAEVETVEAGFQYSDHNPVRLVVELIP